MNYVEKKVKYLGLCIEKDQEYQIEEDDLQMMLKQKLDGTLHQYFAQQLDWHEKN